MVSVGGLALSVAVARTSTIEVFGEFALAFALFTLANGIIQAGVTDTLMAVDPSLEIVKRTSSRVILISLVFAALMFAIGAATNLPFVELGAFGLVGSGLFGYVKTMNLVLFNPRAAFIQQGAWFVASLAASTLVILGGMNAVWGFAAWCWSSAAIGLMAALLSKYRIYPAWNKSPINLRLTAGFAAVFLVLSGSVQVSWALLGQFTGLSTIGTLRAAGTIMGPVNLLVTSSQSLLIPFLSRLMNKDQSRVLRTSILATIFLCLACLPLSLLCAFFPESWGTLLLGDNWSHAQPLLPFLAAELMLTMASLVPMSAHVATLKAGKTMTIRSALGVFRIGLTVGAGILFGPIGVAAAMIVVAASSGVSWWVSFGQIVREPGFNMKNVRLEG